MSAESVELALAKLNAAFQTALYLPDLQQLHAILGAIAANLIPDELPVWLITVGPPSSGKSFILKCLSKLPFVHPASDITAASLLSCTPTKERSKKSSGGLLAKIGSGKTGILVVSDMGSILGTNSKELSHFFALMRDIYDGQLDRLTGQDGGMTYSWHGKLGFVAAVTNTIDQHHGIINSLGDRYLYFRMPSSDIWEKMQRSLRPKTSLESLRASVSDLFAAIDLEAIPALSDATEKALMALAADVAAARTAVTRDRFHRDVTHYPDAEEPMRLHQALRNLFRGIRMIGLSEEAALLLVSRIGGDSLPPARLAVGRLLRGRGGSANTSEIASDAAKLSPALSQMTVRRTLEELAHYGVIDSVGENGVMAQHTLKTFSAIYITIREREKEVQRVGGSSNAEKVPSLSLNRDRRKPGSIAEKVQPISNIGFAALFEPSRGDDGDE